MKVSKEQRKSPQIILKNLKRGDYFTMDGVDIYGVLSKSGDNIHCVALESCLTYDFQPSAEVEQIEIVEITYREK